MWSSLHSCPCLIWSRSRGWCCMPLIARACYKWWGVCTVIDHSLLACEQDLSRYRPDSLLNRLVLVLKVSRCVRQTWEKVSRCSPATLSGLHVWIFFPFLFFFFWRQNSCIMTLVALLWGVFTLVALSFVSSCFWERVSDGSFPECFSSLFHNI